MTTLTFQQIILRLQNYWDEQGCALLQHARQIAPTLWREYPAAAQQQTERWLASRSEYLKA